MNHDTQFLWLQKWMLSSNPEDQCIDVNSLFVFLSYNNKSFILSNTDFRVFPRKVVRRNYCSRDAESLESTDSTISFELLERYHALQFNCISDKEKMEVDEPEFIEKSP